MKRSYRKSELEEELKEIERREEEDTRERFSHLSIPTEIWQIIFDKVESDHAGIWLTLLKSSSIPEQWREAISRRKSLSFPRILDANYNLEKVMKLLANFPFIRKILLVDSRDFKCFSFKEMKGIEELSFYEIGIMRPKRGRVQRNEAIENVLENIRILNISGFSDDNMTRCLMSFSREAKMNLRELKVSNITQSILKELPNLCSLTLSNPIRKGLHFNNNPQINKFTMAFLRPGNVSLPLIEISRDIEISLQGYGVKKIIYKGNLSINQQGISGFCSAELTKVKNKVVILPFQEPILVNEERTHILTGNYVNGKMIGEFTKVRKGCNEVKTIKDMRYYQYGFYFNRHG